MPTTLAGLIPLLVYALVLIIGLYAIRLVLDSTELPPPVRTGIWLIVAVVVLIIVLRMLGVVV